MRTFNYIKTICAIVLSSLVLFSCSKESNDTDAITGATVIPDRFYSSDKMMSRGDVADHIYGQIVTNNSDYITLTDGDEEFDLVDVSLLNKKCVMYIVPCGSASHQDAWTAFDMLERYGGTEALFCKYGDTIYAVHGLDEEAKEVVLYIHRLN